MTRANRERKKTKKINIMKCMYDLPRFDSHFEPQVSLMYRVTAINVTRKGRIGSAE